MEKIKINSMSRIKSQADIAAIKQSVIAAEAAMVAVIAYLKQAAAPTSEEAKEILDATIEAHGCESTMGRIVAGGLGTHEPHYLGEGAIEAGQSIVIDVYPRSKETGFYADMTRTVCIGEPPAELAAMYAAVQEAYKASVAMLRPGVPCRDVHMASVEVFECLGYETTGTGTEFKFAEGFVHAVGHGVGLEVHEAPSLSRSSEDVLQVGDVVTIEPGLYYKHIGGVRLEDLFVITEDGYEQLTALPLELKI